MNDKTEGKLIISAWTSRKSPPNKPQLVTGHIWESNPSVLMVSGQNSPDGKAQIFLAGEWHLTESEAKSSVLTKTERQLEKLERRSLQLAKKLNSLLELKEYCKP